MECQLIEQQGIQEVVDMPDRQIDLLIRFILQNHGKLSKNKHNTYFDYLSAEEVVQIEQAVGQFNNESKVH